MKYQKELGIFLVGWPFCVIAVALVIAAINLPAKDLIAIGIFSGAIGSIILGAWILIK